MLAVVAFVVTAGMGAGAVLLGIRLLRTGASLVSALRRWHQVAPEVPVRGAEVLTEPPGILRIVLAGVGVLTGLGAIVLAVVADGGTSIWVGCGVAAAAVLAAGVIAGLGWWKLRALLRLAAPQASQEAFAPAPYAQPGAPQGQYAAGYSQPGYPQHPGQPAAPHQPSPQGWAPPPPRPPEPQQAAPAQPAHPQPWLPAGAGPGGETWQPEAGGEVDIGDTRLVADTTMSGRSRRPAVVLDDGRRLTTGALTLVGRAPVAKDTDLDVEAVAVLHPTVSKTHASFRISGGKVYVTDRSSTNGSSVVDPDGAKRRLDPWVEEAVEPGWDVLLGSYRVRVVVDEPMP